jgi:hypothetical protein
MITGLKLSEFRSKISDLARPNRFEVQIVPPSSYEYVEGDYNLLSWTVETAQIPSRTQGEIVIKYHGMQLPLPGDYSKEPLTIGFLNTYGWEGKNFFDMWMEFGQQTSEQNIRTSANEQISDSKIIVTQLGRTKSDTLAQYEFYNVFPTNISAIELSSGEADGIEKFTVTFAYSHFASMEVK